MAQRVAGYRTAGEPVSQTRAAAGVTSFGVFRGWRGPDL